MEEVSDHGKVRVEKIKILKNKQDRDRKDDTNDQEKAFFDAGRFADIYSRDIINNDRGKQNQYVNRDKRHVEKTARDQEQTPAIFMRQQEIKRRHDREKHKKLDRIK